MKKNMQMEVLSSALKLNVMQKLLFNPLIFYASKVPD